MVSLSVVFPFGGGSLYGWIIMQLCTCGVLLCGGVSVSDFLLFCGCFVSGVA